MDILRKLFRKKRSMLSALIAAFIMLLIVTSSTSARADGGHDFVSNNLQYKINEDGKTVTLFGYDGDQPSGELIIPATVTNGDKEYSVTAIGESAFGACKSLTSVTIPEGVTSIGDLAFSHCSSLTSVTIPESVTSIGMMAFYEVRHIINKSKCTDPDHWGARVENGTVDGDFVYEDDTKTNLLVYIGKGGEVTIPKGVTSIGNEAFYYCTSLTSVTIPKSVTSIGEGAFSDCTSLTSVTIPEGVTAIGDNAFSICTSLTSVTIPESVTSIGMMAFSDVRHIINKSKCTDPLHLHWGARAENGTVDGDFIYENDTKAKLLVYIGKGGEVTIPDGVTAIGKSAFDACTSLTSVTIPEGVTSIGDYAFIGCSSLTSVTIPESVKSIGDGAFFACHTLHVTIPNSVTSIEGENTFANVKHIINQSSCTNDRHWGAIAENGIVDGDFVYENDSKTTLLSYIGKDEEVTIPSGVTSIGNGAFVYCTSLTSVTIPNSVTSIEDVVFQHCSSLTSVTIPNGVTSIGMGAFADCTSLTSITIPESVTSIGDYAFNSCTSVENVYLYANPDNLTWSENGCDDFITNPKGTTKCHVPVEYFTNYTTKFKDKVNVTFVGDVIQLTADDITTSQISDVTYTGTPFTPEIEVKYGNKTLEAGTDYTITYSNNINAGTAKATIKGIKLYIFTKEVEFTIAKATPEYTLPTIAALPCNATIGDLKKQLAKGFSIQGVPELRIGANTITLTFAPDDPANYNAVEGIALTVTVNGHQYLAPTYTWSSDGKTCTATVVCQNDKSHVVSENATITSKVTTPASTEAKGVTTYTATFKNSLFTTQTKAVEDIDKLKPENPSTPVSSIDNGGNNVKVWSYARTIYIASTPDSQYKIIDLQGRTIATSTTKSSHEEVNINKEGIYVVIINGKSYKVSL